MVIPKVLGNICTGQTKCSDSSNFINCNSSSIGDFYGQDAHYAAQGTCIPKKFKIDDSVPEEKTVIDENFGLEWQQTISTENKSWEDAVKYCEDSIYGGHDDWRLPTIKELFSIVDHGKNDFAIDTTFFPDTPIKKYDRLWSSSSAAVDSKLQWLISYYSLGQASYCQRAASSAYVRCVRGEILSETSSFTSSTRNGDEIITDTKTGLVWQKNYTAEGYIYWKDSLSYCENSTYAGYSDWRLPNVNELMSLINYEERKPASDFPDMIAVYKYFWTSSSTGETVSTISPENGILSTQNKSIIGAVARDMARICVR